MREHSRCGIGLWGLQYLWACCRSSKEQTREALSTPSGGHQLCKYGSTPQGVVDPSEDYGCGHAISEQRAPGKERRRTQRGATLNSAPTSGRAHDRISSADATTPAIPRSPSPSRTTGHSPHGRTSPTRCPERDQRVRLRTQADGLRSKLYTFRYVLRERDADNAREVQDAAAGQFGLLKAGFEKDHHGPPSIGGGWHRRDMVHDDPATAEV